MRRVLFFLTSLVGMVAFCQNPVAPPELGLYADRAGQLRVLRGVAGSLLPGPVLETGVLAAASSGDWAAWKTADRLFVRMGQDVRSWEAPAGAARIRLRGESLAVWFESSESAWEWVPALNDLAPAGWLIRADFPEEGTLGRWTLTRRGETLWIEHRETRLLVPEAVDPAPRLYEILPNLSEVPIAGPIVFPLVGPGDSLIRRFRIRNEGIEALNVNRLSVTVGNFSITDGFTPPRLIPAGRFEDFWLRFAPQSPGPQQATLWVNTTTWEVQGSAPAWASMQAGDEGGAWATLSASRAFDLGSVERGAELRRAFRVTNLNAEIVTVPLLEIAGNGFTIAGGWTEVRELAPGESSGFEVIFRPGSAGVFAGSLTAGSQKFQLTATAREYPLPKPTIEVSPAMESARQEKVVIRFAEVPRTSGTGTLSVAFQPASGLPDDPSVLFPASGARVATFRIVEGAGQADFNGQDGILIQTGTTAGTLTLTSTVAGSSETVKIPIQPARIVVDTAEGLRSDLRIDIRFAAFDNSHAASRVAFTFFQKNGQPVSPGRMEADISKLMQTYFADNPRIGGIFSLRASFPVVGPSSEIERVDVEIVNPSGTTKLNTIRF